MKKIYSFFLLCFVAIGITSCGSNNDDLNRYISEDTLAYLKVNPLELESKLELIKFFNNEKVKNDIPRKLRGLQKFNKTFKTFKDDILELNKDVVLYLNSTSNDETYIGVKAYVKSTDDIEKVVKKLAKKVRADDVETGKEEKNGEEFEYIVVEDLNAAVAYSNNVITMIFGLNSSTTNNLEYLIEDIYDVSEEENINNNIYFSNFNTEESPLSLWISPDFAEEAPSILSSTRDFYIRDREIEYYQRKIQPELEHVFTNGLTAHLFLEDGNYKAKINLNNQEEEVDLEKFLTNDFDEGIKAYLPKSTIGYYALSVNPEKAIDVIDESEIGNELYRELNYSGVDLDEISEYLNGSFIVAATGQKNYVKTYSTMCYKFFEENARKLESFEISEAGYLSSEQKEKLANGETVRTSSYNGRFSINASNQLNKGKSINTIINKNLSVTWYEGGWDYGEYCEESYETDKELVSIVLNHSSKDDIKEFIENDLEESFSKAGNLYQENRANPNIFIAFNDDVVVFTTDKETANNVKSGGFKESLNDAEIGKISNPGFLMTGNADIKTYSKDTQKSLSDEEKNYLKLLNKLISEASVTIDENFEIIANFNLKEKLSLNDIIKVID